MDALAVAALILFVLLLVACAKKREQRKHRKHGEPMSGPANIQLYDIPLWYPNFVAKTLMKWDGDKRCAAYCGQEPCAIWCR